MNNPHRDDRLIQHMLQYCNEINASHAEFDASKDVFLARPSYRNAVALCVLQIGELSNQLSEDFKKTHSHMPWQQMRGLRNIVAHQYGMIDFDSLWITSTEDIVQLRAFCEEYLSQS